MKRAIYAFKHRLEVANLEASQLFTSHCLRGCLRSKKFGCLERECRCSRSQGMSLATEGKLPERTFFFSECLCSRSSGVILMIDIGRTRSELKVCITSLLNVIFKVARRMLCTHTQPLLKLAVNWKCLDEDSADTRVYEEASRNASFLLRFYN